MVKVHIKDGRNHFIAHTDPKNKVVVVILLEVIIMDGPPPHMTDVQTIRHSEHNLGLVYPFHLPTLLG